MVFEIFNNLWVIEQFIEKYLGLVFVYVKKFTEWFTQNLFILQRDSHFLLIRNIKNDKKRKNFQVRTFPCDEFTRKKSSFLFKSTISYSFLKPHKKLLLTYSSFLLLSLQKVYSPFFLSFGIHNSGNKTFINIIFHHA